MSKSKPVREEPILAPTKKLFADSLWMTAAGLLVRAKGVVFIPAIVGAVGFAEYGAFIQIFLIAKLIASVCSVELGMGFERFVSPIARDDKQTISRHLVSILSAALALSVVGALGMWALASWLSDAFLDGGHLASLQVAACVVVSNTVYGSVRAFLHARRRFSRQSVFTVAYELLPYVGFVVAVVATGELWHGVVAYTVLDATAAAAMLAYALRGLLWVRPSAALVRTYARYTAPLALSNLEGGLLDRADRLFISALLGLEAVGIYNIAYRCTELIEFPSRVMRPQMMTYLSAAWDRGAVAVTKDVVRAAIASFLALSIGLVACLAVHADALFALFLGEVEAVSLLPVVVLVGGGVIANACRRFLAVFPRLDNRTHHEFLFQLVGLLLNVAGNLLLIPVLGLHGAALSTFVAYVAILPLYARRYAVAFDAAFYAHVAGFLVLACGVGAAALLFPSDTWAGVLVSLALCVLAYFGLLLWLKRQFFADLRRQLASWQGQPC